MVFEMVSDEEGTRTELALEALAFYMQERTVAKQAAHISTYVRQLRGLKESMDTLRKVEGVLGDVEPLANLTREQAVAIGRDWFYEDDPETVGHVLLNARKLVQSNIEWLAEMRVQYPGIEDAALAFSEAVAQEEAKLRQQFGLDPN